MLFSEWKQNKMRINKAHTKLTAFKKERLISITVGEGALEGTTFNGVPEIILRSDLDLFNFSCWSDFQHMLSTDLPIFNKITTMEHYEPIRTHRDWIHPKVSAFELTIGDEVAYIDVNYARLILKHDFTLTKANTPYLGHGIFKGDQFVGIVMGVLLPDSILKVREEASFRKVQLD